MGRILVVEDNDTMREGMTEVLTLAQHDVTAVASGEEGMELFRKRPHDFVITDLKMPGMDGVQLLTQIRGEDPEALVLLITAFGTVDVAVDAMKHGAFDFLTKPFSPQVLRAKVGKAIEMRRDRARRERLERENEVLRDEVESRFGFDEIVGRSDAMKQIFGVIERVADKDSSVFISGESGTGKELLARAIHRRSRRSQGPFVRVNCGALSETLLESELFGHEKGAFTGAIRRKIGRFELADGGSIFLDEIGDMTPALQLKLLRVLQEREFERVGGEETLHVDVRILSATNKDLTEEVRKGRFREDLFYRLHVVPIHLPPLRERGGDIAILSAHFVEKLRPRTRHRVERMDGETLRLLGGYRWPGNVRELENVLENALVFAEGPVLSPQDLPPQVRGSLASDALALPDDSRPLPDILDELERQLILRAYQKAKGVKTETARILGIKTSALYYKLEKYGIEPRQEGGGGEPDEGPGA